VPKPCSACKSGDPGVSGVWQPQTRCCAYALDRNDKSAPVLRGFGYSPNQWIDAVDVKGANIGVALVEARVAMVAA
jgi:hypothetical protein